MRQSDLAAIIGVTHAQVGAYESGKSYPKFEGLIKMSDFFKVKIGDLIDRDLSISGIQIEYEPATLGEITQTVHKLEQLRGRLIEEYPEVARALGLEVPAGVDGDESVGL